MFEMYKTIPDFPSYEVSNLGNVRNRHTGRHLAQSKTLQGDYKVTLYSEDSDYVATRAVRVLVAEAFVPEPTPECTTVVVLNGNKSDLRAENLVWRPRSIAWNYARQFSMPFSEIDPQYTTVPVWDYNSGRRYDSIYDAALESGLLMDTIYRKASMASHLRPELRDLTPIYPTHYVFVFEGGLY